MAISTTVQSGIIMRRLADGNELWIYPITNADNVMYGEDQLDETLDGIKAAIDALQAVTPDSALSSTSTNPVQNKVLFVALSDKVDKVSGKGLSESDFTAAEKSKLGGISSGAEVNQNAFSTVKVGTTEVQADAKSDVLSLVSGSNVTITADASGDSITIAAKDTTYSDATESVHGLMSTADKTKIDGVEENANNYVHPAYTAKVSGLYKITVDATGHISSATAVAKSDITSLGIPASDTTYSDATQSTHGLMSTNDKTKLDGIETGATKTVVDSVMSSTSTNPVQNKILSGKLDSKAPVISPAFSGAPTAPTPATGTNSTQLATTAFVNTAIGNAIAASDAMVMKGTIGTDGTVTALPTTYKTGWTYRVITAATYAGEVCEVGDLIIALEDRSGSGNLDADWCVAQTNINGAITSIKSASTGAITVSTSGSTTTITHVSITRTNSNAVASPDHGGTFTAVKSVVTNGTGHVTEVETEVVTLPAQYSHPSYTARSAGFNKLTIDVTGHVTAAAAVTKEDVTALGIPAQDTTYSTFTAATASSAGSFGLVPEPASGSQAKFLRGDATWATPINTTYSDATNSVHGLLSVVDKNKLDGIAEGANAYVHPSFNSAAVGLYKISVESEGHVSATDAVTKADITALGIPGSDTKYSNATTSVAGLMSTSDKSRLDKMADNANNYVHPSYTARTSGLYKITVDATGHVSAVTAVAKSDITALGIPGSDTNTTYSPFAGASSTNDGGMGLVPVPAAGDQAKFLRADGSWGTPANTTYSDATQSVHGLMSIADKTKLDGIDTGANNYTHPAYTAKSSGFYKPTIDATGHVSAVTAVSKADITALGIPGQDTTYSAATTTASGLMSSTDKTKLDGVATGANNYTHPSYTQKSSGLYKITVDAYGHVSAVTAVAKADITALGIPGSDTNTTYSTMGAASSSADGTTGLVPAPAAGKQRSFLRGDGTWAVPANTTYSVATTSANGLMSATDKTKLDGIDTGANNYTHPAYTAKSSGLYKITVDATGHVSAVTAVSKTDITDLGIPGQDTNTTYSDVTQSANGLMLATDKTKLDGIAEGANKTTVDSAMSSSSTNPVQNKVVNTALASKANLASPTFTGTPKAPTAAAGTNSTQIATTAFVATAISNGISASDAMVIKGTIGTNGTVTALPTTYKTGWTYRVITAGTYAGQVCEIGDLIIALIDRSGSSNADDDWCVAQTNINGAITGVKGDSNYITVSQSGSVVTITHAATSRSNTTSTAAPAHGGSFTAVKSVTTNGTGHVTAVDTETVTIPAQYSHPAYTAKSSGLYKITVDATGHVSAVTAVSKSDITDLGIPGSDTNTTYSAMTAATSSVAGTTGLVPAPAAGAQAKFLRGDGTWQTPTNTTYSVATTSSNGLMSATDKTKLDGIDTGANNYTHPAYTAKSSGLYKITVDATGHISAATAAAKADITALGIPGSDTTYSAMTAATSSAAGATGLVPAPAAGAQAKFLRGDGTWQTPTNTTYSNMTAATSSTAGKAGLVPAPAAGKQTSFLRGDGTWVVPTNTTYSAATTSANGLMSATDKTKLDGIDTGANNYSHPAYTAKSSGLYKITVDATGHVSAVTAVAKADITALGIPGQDTNTTYSAMTAATSSAAGATGLVPAPAAGAQAKFLRGDGTWQTPTNTTYSNMTAATSSTAGKAGLVPAPAAGAQAKFLRGDGTWQTPATTTYSNATTSTAGLMSATDKTKLDGIATGANNYTHPAYTAKSSGLYKVTVDATGHVSTTTAASSSDISGLLGFLFDLGTSAPTSVTTPTYYMEIELEETA